MSLPKKIFVSYLMNTEELETKQNACLEEDVATKTVGVLPVPADNSLRQICTGERCKRNCDLL